jgi:hypothetical protein
MSPSSAPLDAGPDIDRHCGACPVLRKDLQGAGIALGNDSLSGVFYHILWCLVLGR